MGVEVPEQGRRTNVLPEIKGTELWYRNELVFRKRTGKPKENAMETRGHWMEEV